MVYGENGGENVKPIGNCSLARKRVYRNLLTRWGRQNCYNWQRLVPVGPYSRAIGNVSWWQDYQLCNYQLCIALNVNLFEVFFSSREECLIKKWTDNAMAVSPCLVMTAKGCFSGLSCARYCHTRGKKESRYLKKLATELSFSVWCQYCRHTERKSKRVTRAYFKDPEKCWWS